MTRALAFILTCCLSAAAAIAETPQRTLPAGDAVNVPGTDLTLKLTDVQDGRCPAEVDCYWVGTIRVEIAVTAANAPSATIILCNLCDDATSTARIAGHDITLVDLSPSKEELAALGRPSQLSDYTVALTVAP